MGWLLKVVALVAGLISLTVGFWPLWVSCFGYLAYSLWRSTRKRTVLVRDERKAPQPPKVKKSYFKKRYVLTGVFFVLALVGLSTGGTLSPVVFLSIGVLIFASGLPLRGPSFSEVRPVEHSVLLRNRWLPFSWVSLVEVKFGTAQLSRALGLFGRELFMVVESEKVSVYLPVRVTAFSAPRAEIKVAQELIPVARLLSTRGAYLLPLDSKEAAARLEWKLRSVDLALEYGRDGVASLDSTPFNVLVLRPANHLLESAAAYLTEAKPGSPRIPRTGRKFESQPLMWEALERLGEKYAPQSADGMTNFLSSVCATRGESLGDRLVNGGQTGSGTILVGALGAAQVELTRPQLRTIVRAYG